MSGRSLKTKQITITKKRHSEIFVCGEHQQYSKINSDRILPPIDMGRHILRGVLNTMFSY
jgi:hypothetical protein